MTQPCYPFVAAITVVSVLHRKQLLFSRQSVRLAFPWVKIPSILTHTNHDSQSLPENLIALSEVSLSWFFRIFKHGTSPAQSTSFSGTTYLFRDYMNDVPCIMRQQRDKDNCGVVLSFLPPCFLAATCASLPFVLREDGLREVPKS